MQASLGVAGERAAPQGLLTWAPETRVKHADRIFPYPHDPDRVWVTTEQGIVQTTDDGDTWTLISGTSPQQLGRISDIAFSPSDLNTVFAASREKGVFRSDDLGKTWINVGTEASGLAHASVAKLKTYPGDLKLHTLYALHGSAGAGVSKSMDGGKTWQVLSPDYYGFDMVLIDTEVFMTGYVKDEPDTWCVFKSVDGAQRWSDVVRDVPTTAAVSGRIHKKNQFYTVLKGPILTIVKDTGFYSGPTDGPRWASLFYAYAGKGDEEILYAYDPYKYGLLGSRDGFKTWWKDNDGLFVGPLIKEGANACASANGSTFYAAINGQLYVGRARTSDVPVLAHLKVTPGVIRVSSDKLNAERVKSMGQEAFNKSIAATISVRPTSPDDFKLKAVAADLAPLAQAALALADDGKHNDGAAGDGLFGGVFMPHWMIINRQGDKRPNTPGQTTFAVTATDEKNHNGTGIGVVTVYSTVEPFVFWNGEDQRWGNQLGVTGKGKGHVEEIEMGAHGGTRCLRFTGRHGPWSCCWGFDYYGKNISGHEFLTFWIKVSAPSDRDIKVYLADGPGGEREANNSSAVWLFKENYLQGDSKDWRQVRIPMEKLRKNPGFFYDTTAAIGFGCDDPRGTEFFVDDVVFEP